MPTYLKSIVTVKCLNKNELDWSGLSKKHALQIKPLFIIINYFKPH